MRPGQKTRLARTLRTGSTDAEHALWRVLRARQLHGWKFRRQVPIDRFVVDFVCLDASLIVEVDGGQHADDVARDASRTAILERRGFTVLRFWNTDALTNIEGVVDVVLAALPRPHPSPLPQAGEGAKRVAPHHGSNETTFGSAPVDLEATPCS